MTSTGTTPRELEPPGDTDPDPPGRAVASRGTLDLPPEQMRELGYRVIDMIVDHLGGLRQQPVIDPATPAEMAGILRESLPVGGNDAHAVLDRVDRDVLSHIAHVDHPRNFSFIPGPSNFIGVLADTLASGFNVYAGDWMEASGPAAVEMKAIDWLREVCGLPRSAGGLFVNGGSAANLHALAVARHIRLHDDIRDAVVYTSDQVHSSVDRALWALGFAPGQLRKLKSDDAFRLTPEVLENAISEDLAAGRRPFCVVANAGTTNTGAVDPLRAIANVCSRFGLWLHTDGAYGAAAMLTEAGRRELAGIELSDSITLDPHKWLFQPYEIGCVLVRRATDLPATFTVMAEYLRDVDCADGEVNYADCGLQLTRGFRALKLWMSLEVFGADAFAAAIDHGMALARHAAAIVEASSCWELVAPPALATVAFRYAPDGVPEALLDLVNEELFDRAMVDGFAMVSSTRVDEMAVLRMVPINPRTTVADIEATISRLEILAEELMNELGSMAA